MKKKMVLMLLLTLSITAVGCGKKKAEEDTIVLDNGIVVVDTGVDITEEEAPAATEDVSSERVIEEKKEEVIDESTTLEALQDTTNFTEATVIFNKWITEDESTFIEIKSDSDNTSSIKGDSFEFISNDDTFFVTGQVQGDRIVTKDKEIYNYSIYNQQLHITVKGTEYTLNLATPLQEKTIKEAKQAEIENLEIPEEEKIDTSTLYGGGWVNKERNFAISFTDTLATYALKDIKATREYTIGGPDGTDASMITVGDNIFNFTYELKDGLLYLTDHATGGTIVLEKYLESDFEDLMYEIYG